jgi:hypothetical protein
MTPEIQRILDLLAEAEKYYEIHITLLRAKNAARKVIENSTSTLEFISSEIKPAIIDAHESLRALEDGKLKDKLRTVEHSFAKAEISLRYGEIVKGFDYFRTGLRALARAKKLNNVESQ